MFLSSGWPGSILFSTPSIQAIVMAAKARYGLHDGSGKRTSRRFAFGLGEYMGMRHAAERLRVGEGVGAGGGKVGGRLVARHEPPVRVRGGVREGRERRRVLQDSADVPQPEVREPRVPVAGEERLAALPDRLVAVHARAVVLEDRLGHEGRREPRAAP